MHHEAMYCFEQILGAAPNLTADERTLTSYLTNPLSRTSKTCFTQLEKLKRTNERHSPVNSYIYSRIAINGIHQLPRDIRCRLENLQIAMVDKGRWCTHAHVHARKKVIERERERGGLRTPCYQYDDNDDNV